MQQDAGRQAQPGQSILYTHPDRVGCIDVVNR